MEEKSYVGMYQCFLCGEDIGVVLDERLRNSFPRRVGAIDMEPCDKCKKYMEDGIIFISVRDGERGENPYRTGGWVVVKEEVIPEHMRKQRVYFIEDAVWNKLGLPPVAIRKEVNSVHKRHS